MARAMASPFYSSFPPMTSSKNGDKMTSRPYSDGTADLDHLVLNATKKFTAQNVTPFGLALGVPLHEIKNLRGPLSGDPQTHAIEVYNYWKQNESDRFTEPQQRRERVGSALESAQQNREAEWLRYGKPRAPTIIDLTEEAVYSRLHQIDLDVPRIKLFGHKLGLSDTTIDNILREHENDFESVIAHAIFVKWKSTCKQSDNLMKATLEEAFNEINPPAEVPPPRPTFYTLPTGRPLQPHNTPVEPTVHVITNGHQIDDTQPGEGQPRVDQPHDQSRNDQGINDRTPLVGKDKKKSDVPHMKCCRFMLLVVIFILVILLVIFIVLAFSYTELDTVVILPGDVVSISLPVYTPLSINMKIWGPQYTCSGTVIVAKCNNIEEDTLQYNVLSVNDYFYLAPKSNIGILSQDNPELVLPYEVWLFTDIKDAEMAVQKQFHGVKYNCMEPADGAQCKQLNVGQDALYFKIIKPSYYFIRCERNPFNCSQINHWHIDQVTYNFSLPSIDILHSTVIHAQNISANLIIRQHYDSPIASKNICVLAKLNEEACGSTNNMYFIEINYASMFREIALYAIVLFVIIGGMYTIGVCSYWCIVKHRMRKRNDREIQQ